jgi:hypothetical protein
MITERAVAIFFVGLYNLFLLGVLVIVVRALFDNKN